MAEIVASIRLIISDEESHPAAERSPSTEADGQDAFGSVDFDDLC